MAFSLTAKIAAASLPREGWYAGLMLGGTKLEDIDFQVRLSALYNLPLTGKIQYQNAWGEALQLGYRYDKFRFEGELFYTSHDYSKMIGQMTLTNRPNYFGLSAKGTTSFWTLFFNGFYEFYRTEQELNWVPYLGLGIGYISLGNDLSFSYQGLESYYRHDRVSGIMGQAIAGLSYFFYDNFSLSLDLRYQLSSSNDDIHSDLEVKSLNLLFNWTF